MITNNQTKNQGCKKGHCPSKVESIVRTTGKTKTDIKLRPSGWK